MINNETQEEEEMGITVSISWIDILRIYREVLFTKVTINILLYVFTWTNFVICLTYK